MSGQEKIRPIIGKRIYGLVDASTAAQISKPQEAQEQQFLPRKRQSRFNRVNESPICGDEVMALAYPVSSGAQHKMAGEASGQYSNNFQGYYGDPYSQYACESTQILLTRRASLLEQLAQNPNNYLAQMALQDCDAQLQQYAAYNQSYYYEEHPSDGPSSSNSSNSRPVGMSRKQFNKSQPWVRKDSFRVGTSMKTIAGKHQAKSTNLKGGPSAVKIPDGTAESGSIDLKTGRKDSSTLGASSTAKSNAGDVTFGKHPISALMEYCAKNHLDPPEFIDVAIEGPSHNPTFIMKVKVDSIEYQPTDASKTKKEAKTMAAIVCLQSIGLLATTSAAKNFAVELMGSK